MNKELINKYKEEFNYWVGGGELRIKFLDAATPTWLSNSYGEINDNIWITHSNIIIVIDDILVDYRTAMADGKTIQYFVDGLAGWQDVTNFNNPMKGVENYRIKPKAKIEIYNEPRQSGKTKSLIKMFNDCQTPVFYVTFSVKEAQRVKRMFDSKYHVFILSANNQVELGHLLKNTNEDTLILVDEPFLLNEETQFHIINQVNEVGATLIGLGTKISTNFSDYIVKD